MSPDIMTQNSTSATPQPTSREGPEAHRAVMGPIVAAVGGSESSKVLRAARYLAALTNNNVVAVSAIEPLPTYFAAEAPAMLPPEFELERHEQRRAELAREVREAAGARSGWKTRVLAGDPARLATDLAREDRSPLLIMGIGRHRPLDRLLSRETTLRAIHRAACPVLAVTPNFEPPFREIAIATDFSAASAHAATAAIPLLADGAVVHILHVWQPIALDDRRWRAMDERYERALPEKFRRFRSLLKLPARVTVREEVREGRAAERLLEYAAAHSIDLIVAGRQGLNRMARLVVGSTTTTLLRGATCSVLIAPEPTYPEDDRLRRVLTGVVEVRKPEAWGHELDEFTRRNRGRLATLELDDLDLGVQVTESGFTFQGAAYDPNDERVEIMLSDAERRTQHVTRSIGGVKSIAIGTSDDGRDQALRVNHGAGQTLLTFIPT
jgi:nucleotide-binding universal stress UspA family protein